MKRFILLAFLMLSLTSLMLYAQSTGKSFDEKSQGMVQLQQPVSGSPFCTENLYTNGCSYGNSGLDSWAFADVSVPEIPCSGSYPEWYHDYSELFIHHLDQGVTYTLTVVQNNDNVNTHFDVWIDFNDDNVLTDDELILNDGLIPSTSTPVTYDITLNEVNPGVHYMRVRTNQQVPVTDPCVTYTYGNCCDFKAVVGPRLTTDVGIEAITSPVSGGNLGIENVTIMVKNTGTETQSNIPVFYTIDGMNMVNEIIPGPLEYGAVTEYTFAVQANFSAPVSTVFTFEVCTDLTNDQCPANNCNVSNIVNTLSPVVSSDPQSITQTLKQGETSSGNLTIFNSGPVDLDYSINIEQTGVPFTPPASGLCTENLYSVGCSTDYGLSYWNFAGIESDIPCEGNPAWYHDSTELIHYIIPGETYQMTIARIQGDRSVRVRVWIDFNDDLSLTSDELILNKYLGVAGQLAYTYDISIPEEAQPGNHIMRMRCTTVMNADPCTTYATGNCIDFTASVITPWITSDISSGTIVPEESNEINLNLNTNGLEVGTYEGSVKISSNDINTPVLSVPVTLNVIQPAYSNDLSIIALTSPASGTGMGMEDVTVTIKNEGINPQSNFPIIYTIVGGGAVIETFTGTLEAGATIEYTFTTQADLSASTTTLFSIEACTNLTGDENPANDCQIVEVTNTIIQYPEISVTPGSIDQTIVAGGITSRSLIIGNTGQGVLEYTVGIFTGTQELTAWLSVDPSSGTVVPGDAAGITVTFNTTGMTAGNYTGTITVNSNDPNLPTVEIPVSMLVKSSPWDFVVTGGVHTINVLSSAFPALSAGSFGPGDWVGVFFLNENGEEVCGGAKVINPFGGAVVTAYGDDFTTIQKDGFTSGEVFRWKLYEVSTGTQYQALATYDATMTNQGIFAELGTSKVTLLELTKCQNYSFAEGWNSMSAFVVPSDAQVENLFASLGDGLVIVRDLINVYWPGENINTIGTFDNNTGYAIKVDADNYFSLYGMEYASPNLLLTPGWHYLPVLSECTVNISALFGENLSDIVMIQDLIGTGIFWPEMNIYSLENLDPGKAYKIKVSNETTVSYPECQDNGMIKSSMVENNLLTPWGSLNMTPSTQVTIFTCKAMNNLRNGDVIGAFGRNNQLFGYLEISDIKQNQAMVLFGDDALGSTPFGFTSGENVTFQMIRPSTGEMFDMEVEYDHSAGNNSGQFESGSFAITESTILSAVEFNTDGIVPDVNIYPNPADERITIGLTGVGDETADLTIFDTQGRVVSETTFTGNTNLDVSRLNTGIYFIRVSIKSFTTIKKCEIK